MYDHVLLPTDGSDGTERVAENAIHLARENGATLHVLHVVDTDVLPVDPHSRRLADELEAAGRASMAAIHDRAAEAGVYCVEALRYGSPADEILTYADEYDVDVVVIGTHGRHGVRRALIGSVTERVVRFSEVPVLTVRTLPIDAE
ncbi:universal stress protein [Halobellus rufus]|uniref:universal stress protein n=1 Tax=Halobellus rufus TaxID=1448860 RepID=UPI000679B1D3|nr:universal stress protein [Halobellus rufus]